MVTLRQVIDEFGPGLARIAASYERNPALQEELLQEILLAVHRALPRLRETAKLKPFVFRIAHNRAVSHVRHRLNASEESEVDTDLASSQATPEDTVVDMDRSSQLVAAVRRLPLPYRQVMTLLLEDFTYAEIAAALGISESNVGVRINRAKKQLKAELDHDG